MQKPQILAGFVQALTLGFTSLVKCQAETCHLHTWLMQLTGGSQSPLLQSAPQLQTAATSQSQAPLLRSPMTPLWIRLLLEPSPPTISPTLCIKLLQQHVPMRLQTLHTRPLLASLLTSGMHSSSRGSSTSRFWLPCHTRTSSRGSRAKRASCQQSSMLRTSSALAGKLLRQPSKPFKQPEQSWVPCHSCHRHPSCSRYQSCHSCSKHLQRCPSQKSLYCRSASHSAPGELIASWHRVWRSYIL